MVLCLQVLKPVAAATSKVPALKGLSLKESVSQFSSTMTAQADLRVECAHLRRFYNNFASVSQSVTPPYPFPGCETAEVLIETFEPGEFAFFCVGRTESKTCPLYAQGKFSPLQLYPVSDASRWPRSYFRLTAGAFCVEKGV